MIVNKRKMIQMLNVLFLFATMLFAKAYAIDVPSSDDGIDKDGELIVSPTLAMRCGISSQDPNITTDCVDRLAYDNKSGHIIDSRFENYSDERKAILGEYAGAYLKKSLEKLVESSNYEDKINEDMCIDDSKSSCQNVSNDTRAEIEYNNNLASSNTDIMLDAVKQRGLLLNLYGVRVVLDNIVPTTDVDLTNTSLAGPPK